MKLNLKEFEAILDKCSVGNTLDYVQLLVSADKVKSNLSLPSRELGTILTTDNKFLTGLGPNDIYEMNFNNPNAEIAPHLKLFVSEELECTITKAAKGEIASIKVTEKETKMTAKWNLASAIQARVFNNPSFTKDIQFFAEVVIDEQFAARVQALKKIAFASNKIYFSTSNKKLHIETGDRKQSHVNTFQIELQDVDKSLPIGFEGIAICVNAKIFVSVIEHIATDKTFKVKLAYKPEKKIGMICVTNDSTETYIIAQIMEVDQNPKVKK
jgi:hypothetical protein